MTLLHSYYHHIENGGITIRFKKDKYSTCLIETVTEYHGHPSITTTLNLQGHNQNQVLQEIGLAFLKVSTLIK